MVLRAIRVANSRVCFPLAYAALLLSLLTPLQARAWGSSANKLVVNRAIETLPQDIRPFFESSRGFLLLHVSDPSTEKTPAERPIAVADRRVQPKIDRIHARRPMG